MPTNAQLIQIIKIQTEIAKLGLDLGAVMQLVVERALPLIHADGAAIELAEDGEMVYRAASGIAARQLGLRLKIGASLSGLCVTTGEPLSCPDSDKDPRVDRVACNNIGLRSMIVLPLKHMEITVGVIKAMSTQPNKFNRQAISLLGMLTEMIAAAMFYAVKYDNDALFIKATHDGMTGLANKALFMDRLRSIISQAKAERQLSALVISDMDGLKQINDNFGHRIGDAVILEFANRLKQVTRSSDTPARLGGDEFGVILTPLENPESVNAVIRRFESQLALPFVFENKPFQLKASVGSALIPHEGTDAETLLDLADRRMYSVKKARKRKR